MNGASIAKFRTRRPAHICETSRGTAIVAYGALFATDGLAIVAALIVSTLVAVLIGGAIAAAAEHSGTGVP
jgi:hypothetical protein